MKIRDFDGVLPILNAREKNLRQAFSMVLNTLNGERRARVP